eukprot:3600190-Heterocapsa_arctica.AAC.1
MINIEKSLYPKTDTTSPKLYADLKTFRARRPTFEVPRARSVRASPRLSSPELVPCAQAHV